MRDDAHDDDDEIATPRFYRARRTGGVRAGTDRRHRRRAHGRERRVPSQRQERRSSRHDDARQINARSRCDDVSVVGRAGWWDVGWGGTTWDGEGRRDRSRLEVGIYPHDRDVLFFEKSQTWDSERQSMYERQTITRRAGVSE